MTNATHMGQAGLQGWREKLADAVSEPVAQRAPVDEDQVRAFIGAAFFVLALTYVFKTVSILVREAREG